MTGGVRMMKMFSSCSEWPSGGVIRTLQSNINIYYPPQSAAPLTYIGRSAGIPSSCSLSITSLVALGSAKLPSSAKLARLGHFPPASHGGLPCWVSPFSLIQHLRQCTCLSFLCCCCSPRHSGPAECGPGPRGSAGQPNHGNRVQLCCAGWPTYLYPGIARDRSVVI